MALFIGEVTSLADIVWYSSKKEIVEEDEIFRGHSAIHTDVIVIDFMQTTLKIIFLLPSNFMTVPVYYRVLAKLIDRKDPEEVFLRRRVISRDNSTIDIIAKNRDDLEKIARCIDFHDKRLIRCGAWRRLLWQ